MCDVDEISLGHGALMTYLYGVTQAAFASRRVSLGFLRFGVLVCLSALLLGLATSDLEMPHCFP
jgi:membrane-associated phospholipid phosphatase